MVRPNDPFWDYAEKMAGGLFKCMFCEYIFAVATSISRIKSHFAGVKGRGINVCAKVPREIQEAAYLAIHGSKKKRKTKSSLSNNEVPKMDSTSSGEEKNDLEFFAKNVEEMLMEVESSDEIENKSAGESVQLVEMGSSQDGSTADEDETGGNAFPRLDLIGQSIEKGWHEIYSLAIEKGDLNSGRENMDGDFIPEGLHETRRDALPKPEIMSRKKHNGSIADEDETGGDAFPRLDLIGQSIEKDWHEVYSLSIEKDDLNVGRENMDGDFIPEGLHENRRDALPKPELVGQVFKRNTDEVWSLLQEEPVLTIGICGMRGMGKTTLAMHIYNLLLKPTNSFHHIYWVTVTQDFTIYKLQNLIAKTIDLDLSNEKDEKRRAAKLSKAFFTKQKSVLILDNLQNHFDVEKVGIPVSRNKCKLMFTTRSLDVCKGMTCLERVVKVEPLSEQEAWSLFSKELGNYDDKVEPFAKFVSSKCTGLPLLGIKTMARSMRGVDDVYVWKKTLVELEESNRKQGSMEFEMFWVLKFSYKGLNDSSLQQCFLCCALFPADFKINRNDLIEYLIVERIIEPIGSRQSQFDKGHSMLNRLENACLLESYITEDYRYVKMHDLIRDMALQIMNSRAMVRAGVQLTEFPDEEKWTEDLLRVSLMENDIEEVPSSLSPRCPNLATLLLRGNNKLKLITDSFLKQLCRLKVLDLSFTGILDLPGSISGLVFLTALLLRCCCNLRRVPSLAKLRKLKKLDFGYATIEEVPRGLELLSNLRYLNLDGTRLKEFPATMLSNLSHLQFLHLGQSLRGIRAVEVKDVANLRNLESLKCHFYDLIDFNRYLKYQEKRRPLSTYNIGIGQLGGNILTDFMLSTISKKEITKQVRLFNCNIGKRGDFLALPEGIQKLVIAKCHDARNVCNLQASGLKSFIISECDCIECLLSLPIFSTDILDSLETLHLYLLKNLLVLFGREGAILQPLPSIGTFSCLRTFEVFNCPNMKKLFPSGLLSNLRNLEVIEVECCDKMEELIASEGEEGEEEEKDVGAIMGEERNSSSRSTDTSSEFTLPKLRQLKLRNLSELKSICRGVMICDSLQELDFFNCLKLKRIPFYLALHENGLPSIRRIHAYPKKWWESVEWNQYSASNTIQLICDVVLSERLDKLPGQWKHASSNALRGIPKDSCGSYDDSCVRYVSCNSYEKAN